MFGIGVIVGNVSLDTPHSSEKSLEYLPVEVAANYSKELVLTDT